MALLSEMRRRNIFKVSLAYAILSWLIVQLASLVLPLFDTPPWVLQILVLTLILLFPVAVLLAWAFELTPKGFRPTSDVEREQSITDETGQRLNYIVVSLAAVALVYLLVDHYMLATDVEPDPDLAYRRSVAVLPFVARGTLDARQQLIVDGVHEELLDKLSKLPGTRLIAAASVAPYRGSSKKLPGIAAELGVGSVMLGEARLAEDTIRLDLQLLDARSGEHLWADAYNVRLDPADIYAGLIDTTLAVAEILQLDPDIESRDLINHVPTVRMDALTNFFAGRQRAAGSATDGVARAIEDFESAVRLDPQFARAWAALANAWLELPDLMSASRVDRVRRQAAAAAMRAVFVDPNAPDALSALGWHLLVHNYDWSGAELSFRRALAAENSNVGALRRYSQLLSWQGQHDEALRAAELAVAADPLSVRTGTDRVRILVNARQWNEAFDVGYRLLERGPHPPLMMTLWIAELRARRPQDAAAHLLAWAVATGRDVQAASEVGGLVIRAQGMGESVELPADLVERLGLGAEAAEIYAAIGDAEHTLAALQQAQHSDGFRSILSMKINPLYDFVRDDTRFISLLKEAGLAY